MATKQGYLKEKGSQDKLAPKTLDSLVKDSARNRALSASLQELAERQCLGYPPFATTQNYTVGDKVFHDRKLWKFTSAHTAGAWNASHVTAWSVDDEVSELKLAVTELDERKANIDGFYEGMGVGVAKRLEGNTDVAGSFLERTTGGDAELANGLAQLNEVQGGSVKFNQLANGADCTDLTKVSVVGGEAVIENGTIHVNRGSHTESTYGVAFNNEKNIVKDHKYLISADVKVTSINPDSSFLYNAKNPYLSITTGACFRNSLIVDIKVRPDSAGAFVNLSTIVTAYGNSDYNKPYRCLSFGTQGVTDITSEDLTDFYIKNPKFTDLTDIFGAGNEPATVEEFESWLAENVGLQEYYDYTEGEVVNNNMTGIESTGFNLFNPTTGKARIIGAYSDVYGNYYGIRGTYGTLTFEDDLGNVSTVTPDADGKLEFDVSGYINVADAGNDVAVFLWWDGKKTDYEDYDVEIAHLDVRHIYGKKNGTGELVQVWPTGMPRINDIVDKLCIENGAIVAKRHIAEVDMGSLTYMSSSTVQNGFVAEIEVIKHYNDLAYLSTIAPNVLCQRYTACAYNVLFDKGICYRQNAILSGILIKDSAFDGYTVQQVATALSGVLLYFELVTPETYTDLVYMGSEYFADGTPVALPVNYKVDNWGVETILPKNTSTILTAKPTIKVRYAIDAVEQLNTHSDEIDSLHDDIDELDEAKANTVGVYDDMVVGAAKAIAGNQRLDKEFTSMIVDGADGVAKINEVRGKSLVWNQMVAPSHVVTSGAESAGLTATKDGRFLTINGTVQGEGNVEILLVNSAYVKRDNTKYLFLANKVIPYDWGLSGYPYYNNTNGFIFQNNAGSLWQGYIRINVLAGTEISLTNVTFSIIDLTKMFGAGNEPATVAEFEAMFPDAYYEYNDGEIINNATEELNVTGFNQWDEEWEVGGWNDEGQKIPVPDYIRCANKIPILPNTSYFFKRPVVGNYGHYFDSNGNVLGVGFTLPNGMFTTPSNAHYMVFTLRQTTYNNDICINIPDPSRNGTYEPYKHGVVPLNLSTITGKQVGVEDAESVVIFPDGMRQAGSVADTLLVDDDGYARRALVKIGSVDLGTLTWLYSASQLRFYITTSIGAKALSNASAANAICEKYQVVAINKTNYEIVGSYVDKAVGISTEGTMSISDSAYTDATTFKTAMNGVILNYELAEYKEYILDEPILMTFKAYHGGTIVQSPQAPDSAPMSMNVTFALDAVGTLNNLPKNYISADSMDAFLAQLGTAMNGTWTKSWDAANSKYTFSFQSSQTE